MTENVLFKMSVIVDYYSNQMSRKIIVSSVLGVGQYLV